MAIALILLSLAHALGLALTFLVGWGTRSAMFTAETHLYLAIGFVALGLFVHSMILFYFIGTGKTLKEAIARFGLQGDYNKRLRWFKMQTSGPLTLAAGLMIVTSALGGRILWGRSSSPHFWVGLLTVVLNFWVVIREIRAIALNVALFHEVEEKVGNLEPDDGSPTPAQSQTPAAEGSA